MGTGEVRVGVVVVEVESLTTTRKKRTRRRTVKGKLSNRLELFVAVAELSPRLSTAPIDPEMH